MTRVVHLTRSRSPRRAAALATIALLSAGTLSACQWTSPIQTDSTYVAADGVPVNAGPVEVRNLLIVSGAQNGPGTLVGSVVNTSTEAATVSFAVDGGTPVQVQVPAGAQVSLSDATKKTAIGTVKAEPGTWTDVQVTTAAAGTITANVPVQYPYPPYQEVAPSGFTPRPSASASESAAEGH